MKIRRKVTVVADNFEIISFQRYSEERINWRKEDRIRDKVRSENNWLSLLAEQAEVEDRLYSECDLLDAVKTNPWTNQKHIYSLQVWYTYELEVNYTYDGHSYENTVCYATEYDRLTEGRRLDVTFHRDNPQQILSVSVHPESIWEFILFSTM